MAACGRGEALGQSASSTGPSMVVTFGSPAPPPVVAAAAVPVAVPAPVANTTPAYVVAPQTPVVPPPHGGTANAAVPAATPLVAAPAAPVVVVPQATAYAQLPPQVPGGSGTPTAGAVRVQPPASTAPLPQATYPEFVPLASPADQADWSTPAGSIFYPAEAIPSFDPLPETGTVRLTGSESPFSLANRRRQDLGAAPTAPLPPGAAPVMPTAPVSELAVFSSGRPTDPLDYWSPRNEFRTSKAQQFGWTEFVTRHGPLFTVGSGFVEDRCETGWLFEGGIRQPLTHPGRRWVLFGELGGGYHGNLGDGVSRVTSGTFIDPNRVFGLTADLNDFYNTQMTSLRRGIAYGALGFHFQPEMWHAPGRHQVRVTCRLGGRIGHIAARYNQTPTATLQALIDSQTALYGVVGPPVGFIYGSNVNLSDTLLGMFASTAIGWTQYGVCLGPFCFRELSLAAEVQYGHDWFDLGDYSRGDRGLGTVGTLFNLNFGY